MKTTSPTKAKKQKEILSAEEQKRQTIRKFIITSCVVIVMLALVALVYNVTILANRNSNIRGLEALNTELYNQQQQIDDAILERQCPEFIEDFARRYLEMHRRDEVMFIGR